MLQIRATTQPLAHFPKPTHGSVWLVLYVGKTAWTSSADSLRLLIDAQNPLAESDNRAYLSSKEQSETETIKTVPSLMLLAEHRAEAR
jgi:hypothetical protein